MTIARQAPWLLAAPLAIVILCEAVPSPPRVVPPASRPPDPDITPVRHRPAPDLAAILARPLFTPGRRPASDDHAAPPPRLAGTVIGPDGVRLAILALPGRDRPLVLRQGGSGSGVSVIAVTPGRVLAALAQGRILLTLRGAERLDATPAVAPEMTKDARLRSPNNQDE